MLAFVTLFVVFGSALVTSSPLSAQVPINLSLDNSTVTFDVKQAATNAKRLNKELISLSIEFGNTVDFFGDVGSRNDFSWRLLQNVVERSGSHPVLRLGGNTQDITTYCEDCSDTLHSVIEQDPENPLSSEAVNVTINKNIFRVMEENLPTEARFIFGLNLGMDEYLVARDELNGALKHLDQSRVMAFELGNEANVYTIVGDRRPKDWTIIDYGRQIIDWLSRLQTESDAAGSLNFQFGSFVGPPTSFGNRSLLQLTKMGVPQNIKGVRYFASHGYPEHACTKESSALIQLPNYMNHLKTVNFVDQYQGEIAAAHSVGAVFHIGETQSAGCHGKDGVSNTMGALLWALDYALCGATVGVERYFFHNGKGGFYYAMWEPLAVNSSVPAHINPMYFSMLFVADVVRDLRDPYIARIVELDTDNLAHYAIYEQRSLLKKMIILNTKYYDKTAGSRPVKTLDLSPALGKRLSVRRLTAESSVSKDGVTWAGQSVNSSGHIIDDEAVERVSDGVVELRASEAVIVEGVAI